MVAVGVDVKTAQYRLRRANVSTTLQVYARATEEADRRAAELRERRFGPRDGHGIDRQPCEKPQVSAPPTGFEPVPPP
jgi:hypothetical protein